MNIKTTTTAAAAAALTVLALTGCASGPSADEIAASQAASDASTQVANAAVCFGFANQHNQLVAVLYKGVQYASDDAVLESITTTMHEYLQKLTAFQATESISEGIAKVVSLVPEDASQMLRDSAASAKYIDAADNLVDECIANDAFIYLVENDNFFG